MRARWASGRCRRSLLPASNLLGVRVVVAFAAVAHLRDRDSPRNVTPISRTPGRSTTSWPSPRSGSPRPRPRARTSPSSFATTSGGTLNDSADAQPLGGGRAAASASAVAGDRVEQQRRVAHRARHERRSASGRASRSGRLGRDRHAVLLRLEPDEPAARGRDADRAERRPTPSPRRPCRRPPPRALPPLEPPACARGPTGCA